MKYRTASFGILVVCLSASTSIAAVTLLSTSVPILTNAGANQNASSLALGLNYVSGSIFSPTATNTLFSGLTIVQSDSGKSFVASSTTDSQFDGFAALLTDGTDGNVGGGVILGTVYVSPLIGGNSESSFFTLPAGSNGIDFQGFTIDHIDFLVNSVSINSPGSNPNEDGVWTDYNLSGVFQVFGEQIVAVPEPSSIGLVALGTMALVIRRRRSSDGKGAVAAMVPS